MNPRPPRLGKHLLEVLRQQIDGGDPPETAEAYHRLLAEGYAEDEVYRMLACVLTSEMFELQRQERDFDRQRYAKLLRALPQLPWE